MRIGFKKLAANGDVDQRLGGSLTHLVLLALDCSCY